MKRQWKGFVAGMLAAMVLFTLVTPTLAALAGKTIQVYTGVDVYVDDVKVEPKDANGNPVEVFVYNGTTYLPIRAISNALGKPVQWEGKTNSAYVGKHQGDKPAVWLKDLDYFVGSSWDTYNGKDNLGVEHRDAIQGPIYSGSTTNTYLINGQYSAISGSFFQKYDKRSSFGVSILEIYGDDELLYSAEMEGGIKPLDFYVSLNGVLELKVKLSGYGVGAAVADCGLWS